MYLVLFLMASLLETSELGQKYPDVPLPLLLRLLIPAHFLLSVTRRIPLGYVGVVTFFERPISDGEGEGPVFVPLLTHQLKIVPRKLQEIEIPGPADSIWRGEVDEMPDGKFPAFRVTHAETDNKDMMSRPIETIAGQPPVTLAPYEIPLKPDGKVDEERLDFLRSDRYTAEYEVRAKYRITNPGDFLKNFDGLTEFEQIAEDAVKGTMQTVLPKITIGTALENLGLLSKVLKQDLCTKITQDIPDAAVGVEIGDVEIKAVNLSHLLNTSMRLRIQARYERQTTVTNAKATAEKVILEGDAAAKAKAAPFREQATVWEDHPAARTAFIIEAFKESTGNAKPVIIAGMGGNAEQGNLMGMAAALMGEMLREPRQTPPQP